MAAQLLPSHLQFRRKKGTRRDGEERKERNWEGKKREGRKYEREGRMCFFPKDKNQKLHILLPLTYHWSELRYMATPSYKEN